MERRSLLGQIMDCIRCGEVDGQIDDLHRVIHERQAVLDKAPTLENQEIKVQYTMTNGGVEILQVRAK